MVSRVFTVYNYKHGDILCMTFTRIVLLWLINVTSYKIHVGLALQLW